MLFCLFLHYLFSVPSLQDWDVECGAGSFAVFFPSDACLFGGCSHGSGVQRVSGILHQLSLIYRLPVGWRTLVQLLYQTFSLHYALPTYYAVRLSKFNTYSSLCIMKHLFAAHLYLTQVFYSSLPYNVNVVILWNGFHRIYMEF